jgi:hypothetical protein
VSRFAALKSGQAATKATDPNLPIPQPAKASARASKKMVAGYFSPEMSRALHLLAVEEGSSLQALMGEAFDDLMRKYGKHPFGER